MGSTVRDTKAYAGAAAGVSGFGEGDGRTGRPADRRTDGQTDRRADGQTGRPADRQTGRPADRLPVARQFVVCCNGSGRSATTYAITAITATHRATSAGSSLSSMSPSLW